MLKCVVGKWFDTLDQEDQTAVLEADDHMPRAELHRKIMSVYPGAFGLTALKCHVTNVCVCGRQSGE